MGRRGGQREQEQGPKHDRSSDARPVPVRQIKALRIRFPCYLGQSPPFWDCMRVRGSELQDVESFPIDGLVADGDIAEAVARAGLRPGEGDGCRGEGPKDGVLCVAVTGAICRRGLSRGMVTRAKPGGWRA